MNPRFKHSGTPKRFEQAELSDFREFQAVQDFLFDHEAWSSTIISNEQTFWLDEKWRTLIINGPVGVGKTHLACAIAKEYCKRAGAFYISAYNLSQRIIADRSADFFNQYSLLIIDEVGRSFETKAEKDRFFDLVNRRYENLKPLILLGNFQIKTLREMLGEAVADRIGEEMSYLTLTGKSRRGVK